MVVIRLLLMTFGLFAADISLAAPTSFGQITRSDGLPPLPESRRWLADGEAPQTYTVQPGDTLFDICDQLLDEPNYWPKLWAMNDYIRNPHFIYAGMRLRFYPATTEHPPFLEVVMEDDTIPIHDAALNPKELISEDISGLLIAEQEPKAPEVVSASQITGLNQDELSVFGNYFRPTQRKVILPVIISDDDMDPEGTVILGTDGKTLMSTAHQVIVEGETLEVNTPYLVVRPSAEIYDPESEPLGKRYEVVGSLQTLGSIYPPDRLSAKIRDNRLGVQPGDWLIPYRSIVRQVPFNITAQRLNTDNSIVGFGYPHKTFGGQGQFVLFDNTNQVLKPEMAVVVFQEHRQLAMSHHKIDLPDISDPVAWVYIVETTSDVAIGFISSAIREVRLGDSLAL